MAYTTNPSLLAALKNGKNVHWLDFQKTYKPLVMLRAKDFNLTRDEADELMQSVLLDVFHQCESFQYDPTKGRFRDYMRKLIGNNCIDIIRRRKSNADENTVRQNLRKSQMKATNSAGWRNGTTISLNKQLPCSRQRWNPAHSWPTKCTRSRECQSLKLQNALT